MKKQTEAPMKRIENWSTCEGKKIEAPIKLKENWSTFQVKRKYIHISFNI